MSAWTNGKLVLFRDCFQILFLILLSTLLPEAVARRCSVKKMFLEISQNSQEKLVLVSFLIKLQAKACNFIKKEAVAQVFFVDFAKFLRTPFLIDQPRVAASFQC